MKPSRITAKLDFVTCSPPWSFAARWQQPSVCSIHQGVIQVKSITRFVFVAALVVFAFQLMGCATVTRGTTQDVSFNSNPPFATATVESTGQSCTTPCNMKVKRRTNSQVTFRKDCYSPVSHVITSSISGNGTLGLSGNIILGGVIGAGVDVASGAMNDLSSTNFFATLNPIPGCGTNAPAQTTVAPVQPKQANAANAKGVVVSVARPAQPEQREEIDMSWLEPIVAQCDKPTYSDAEFQRCVEPKANEYMIANDIKAVIAFGDGGES